MGFRYIGQAGLELLTSGDPPASSSQNVGITGVSDCAQPAPQYQVTASTYRVEGAMVRVVLRSKLMEEPEQGQGGISGRGKRQQLLLHNFVASGQAGRLERRGRAPGGKHGPSGKSQILPCC